MAAGNVSPLVVLREHPLEWKTGERISISAPRSPRGLFCWREDDVLQNPVSSPTEKQLQSSLKATDKTTVVLGLSIGGRVFMAKSYWEGTKVGDTEMKEGDIRCATEQPAEGEKVVETIRS